MFLLIVVFLFSSSSCVIIDQACTTNGKFDARAVNCANIYPDPACAALYGAPPTAGSDTDRNPACYSSLGQTIDHELKSLSSEICARQCGYCCQSPAYNCMNNPRPRISCEQVTHRMCRNPMWAELLAEDCPNVCGFCERNCVDLVPDCAVDKLICRRIGLETWVQQNCRRTCGYCNTTTTKVTTGGTTSSTLGVGSCSIYPPDNNPKKVLLETLLHPGLSDVPPSNSTASAPRITSIWPSNGSIALQLARSVDLSFIFVLYHGSIYLLIELFYERERPTVRKEQPAVRLLPLVMSARDTIKAFNSIAEKTDASLKKNPFSDTYDVQKFDKAALDYGRPPPGSKTEARGIKAGVHVCREILFLCETINENADGPPEARVIKFGKLFYVYSFYSDKLVGMLIRARKYGLVEFEGEMLYQRQDDNKDVKMLMSIDEIRRRMRASGDPKNCVTFIK